MSERLPEDPFSGMAGHGFQVHEMFISYQAAGFTTDEALYLVGVVLGVAARATLIDEK